MDKVSERRLAENEVFFRQQNESVERGFERIRQLTAEENHESFVSDDDAPLYFYCECSNENCRKRIRLKPSVYNAVHKKRDHFIVVPGHEVLEVEQVVQTEQKYYVTQKRVSPPDSADHLNVTDV